jgi:hypothetical protein
LQPVKRFRQNSCRQAMQAEAVNRRWTHNFASAGWAERATYCLGGRLKLSILSYANRLAAHVKIREGANLL